MKQLLAPIYGNSGGLEIPSFRSDQLDYIKLQVLVASKACKFEVADCISHSQKLFNMLKLSPTGKSL